MTFIVSDFNQLTQQLADANRNIQTKESNNKSLEKDLLTYKAEIGRMSQTNLHLAQKATTPTCSRCRM